MQLFDTKGRGIDRVTENAVVFEDNHYEVDCLIFATGFEVGTGYTRRAGYDVVGRDGIRLSDKWANGLSTFHGFQSRGFPNCFHMGLTQSTLTVNFTHLLDEQSIHIGYIVGQVTAAEAQTVETSEEAESAWVETIRTLARQDDKFRAECTPGYYNTEGKSSAATDFTGGQYGPGPIEFFKLLSEWRSEGKLSGLEIS